MTKPFLTYQQQINKLIMDKHLVINNMAYAEEKLKEIGYFSLIGGYKKPFRNPMTRIYENNTTFEDIFALYQFDNALRKLVFHYLAQIEKKLSATISYAFCEQYGELQNAYLDVYNYDYSASNRCGIDKLVSMLDKLANINTDHEYIVHQRNVYQNVPLWVLINSLTFGQLSKMYSFLQPQLKSKISSNFRYINERELNQYLKVLVLYRNVCAHNERLFSHTVYSEIPDTVLHKKLGIHKNGNQYIKGKKDLFSVIIAFRYFLTNQDFVCFKKALTKLIEKYLKESQRIMEVQLLDMMGFPINWKCITRYKL